MLKEDKVAQSTVLEVTPLVLEVTEEIIQDMVLTVEMTVQVILVVLVEVV